MLRNRKGFTLIELLIVVVIIGILAAIALPKFSSARERAYFSSMKSDLKSLATAEEIFYSKNLAYGDSADIGFVGSKGVTVAIALVNDSAGATDQVFTGVATHSALGTDVGCAIYSGSVASGTSPISTPGGVAADKPSVPICDTEN